MNEVARLKALLDDSERSAKNLHKNVRDSICKFILSFFAIFSITVIYVISMLTTSILGYSSWKANL